MVKTEIEYADQAVRATTPARTGWPIELDQVFERAVTVEYASLTGAGAPITVPVTPYTSPGSGTIDVSTGVTYPSKAERARRNPKVALLFADAMGSSSQLPVVLVQGLATVRDADLQANTDRYVRSVTERFPEALASQPRWLVRRSAWYLARIWVHITPLRMLWWPGRLLDTAPREWIAPEGTQAPPSDPAPKGAAPRSLTQQRPDWRAEAAPATSFPMHDLTVVGPDGFPLITPVLEFERTLDGFRFRLPAGIELPNAGPACLTAHAHDVPFTSQQNRTFVGQFIRGQDRTAQIVVDRLLAHWSIPSGRLQAAISFLSKGRHLRPRLAAESGRRGQRPPEARLPSPARAGRQGRER